MGNEVDEFAEDRKVLQEFFTGILEAGSSHQAVGYGSEESQLTRFRVLTEIGDLSDSTILDVGCGLGRLYDYLRSAGHETAQYMGIDINWVSIHAARLASPDAKFEIQDLLKWSYLDKFDWVLASGIFNIETPNRAEYVFKTLEAMFRACKRGVGVNFVSDWSPGAREQRTVYADPAEILDLVCRALSSKVVLRHDYRPNDFTIYVYKDAS